MALDNIWKVHSIGFINQANVLDLNHASHVYINALSSFAMPVQATATKFVPAAETFATSGYLTFQSHDVNFTTTQADKAFNKIGVGGACFDAAGGTDEIHIYAAKFTCSGPTVQVQHRRYEIKKGMIFLQSANCDHQGNLEVSAQIRAVYDGPNTPVDVVDNVALPTAASLATDQNDQWTLATSADTSLNGSLVYGKRGVNIDFGVSTSTQGADSDAYDTFASIDSIQPVLTCNGVDPTWFHDLEGSGLGLSGQGKAVTHANTAFAFRKRDGAGGFVDDATAQHIIITAYGPAYYDQALSGSGTDAATTSFRIECLKDGLGNAPLVITTATAI